jgi:hypothetical protein
VCLFVLRDLMSFDRYLMQQKSCAQGLQAPLAHAPVNAQYARARARRAKNRTDWCSKVCRGATFCQRTLIFKTTTDAIANQKPRKQ